MNVHVGSAVGLSNIWQFPFKTSVEGGAAFVFVYLIAAFLIGLPAILGEFVVGRRSNINAVEAFDRLNHLAWTVVGALGLFTGLWIRSYYSVVGGWVTSYIAGSATGAYFAALAEYFASVSTGWEAIAFHAGFMAVTAGIVAFGVEDDQRRDVRVGLAVVDPALRARRRVRHVAPLRHRYLFCAPRLTVYYCRILNR